MSDREVKISCDRESGGNETDQISIQNCIYFIDFGSETFVGLSTMLVISLNYDIDWIGCYFTILLNYLFVHFCITYDSPVAITNRRLAAHVFYLPNMTTFHTGI